MNKSLFRHLCTGGTENSDVYLQNHRIANAGQDLPDHPGHPFSYYQDFPCPLVQHLPYDSSGFDFHLGDVYVFVLVWFIFQLTLEIQNRIKIHRCAAFTRHTTHNVGTGTAVIGIFEKLLFTYIVPLVINYIWLYLTTVDR